MRRVSICSTEGRSLESTNTAAAPRASAKSAPPPAIFIIVLKVSPLISFFICHFLRSLFVRIHYGQKQRETASPPRRHREQNRPDPSKGSGRLRDKLLKRVIPRVPLLPRRPLFLPRRLLRPAATPPRHPLRRSGRDGRGAAPVRST